MGMGTTAVCVCSLTLNDVMTYKNTFTVVHDLLW